jgi:hypothetical protein
MLSVSNLAVVMIVWMVLLANLPFITKPYFLCIHTSKTRSSNTSHIKWHKPFAGCLMELVVYYGVFITSHLYLAYQMGYLLWQPFSFYAITFLIFIAMAFFGVCYRFLYRP